MSANYTKWTNFWENLTPLNSSHIKIFLGFFLEIFHFFKFKFNFWIWAGLVPAPVKPDRFPPVRGTWPQPAEHNMDVPGGSQPVREWQTSTWFYENPDDHQTLLCSPDLFWQEWSSWMAEYIHSAMDAGICQSTDLLGLDTPFLLGSIA